MEISENSAKKEKPAVVQEFKVHKCDVRLELTCP